jgi:two-component system NtrC family sensor kinase
VVTSFLNKLKLRWKLLSLVLPLVIIPILIVGAMIGYIANHQAYLGVTQTSKDDLQHMVAFTIDLLDTHHQHYRYDEHNKTYLLVDQGLADYRAFIVGHQIT